jgi:hypothetical protein
MDISSVKLSLVKYKMNKMQLIIPTLSEPYNVEPSLITNITIDFDYYGYIFPFFEIDLTIPNSIYRIMKKNNTNLKAYINLQKGYFRNASNNGEDKPAFSNYLNDTFYIFMEDCTPDLSETKQKEVEKSNNSYNQMANVKLLIYNYDYYNNYNTPVNGVLASATLVDALSYVLNKAGLSKVLLSPPNNYKRYSEFIITPLHAIDQLERICNEYGMHTLGTLIFFDLKCLYIIDKGLKCTAYQNNEFKVTHLISCPIRAEQSLIQSGCYRNNVDKYNVININANSVSCKDLSELNDNIYGNKLITINTSNGSIREANLNTNNTSRPFVMTVNKGDNTESAFMNELSDATREFTCAVSSIDLDMLTPNKQFIITIDDIGLKKYNGKYRLMRTVVTFTRDGDYFNPMTVCNFRG